MSDNSGGVVPGVTVFAVESGTGISRDTVTGANGRYSFVSLRPTTYEIRAELAGFRTVRQTAVVLQANQNLTLNITLELGELSETVTVAGETSTVDITQSTLSEVVDSKRIVELPLNGRDAARLSMLVSGMVVTEVNQESGKTIPGALRLSTNGTESRQASFRLDGTNHTDSYFQQNQPFPFPDALQEFSIQTSNYSAAQGASAGAVVNAVTRSGTNNFNGGAFAYARDRTFNSKNFFLPERDFLKRKQYGGYAGGPIMRNKMFFFGGWQGTTIQNVGGTLNNTVPTAAMRAGDFSAITTPLRDPNGGFFPNNQIPVGRFDPASVNVMKYLPVGPGNGVGGLVQVPRRIGQDDNQIIAKIDSQLNAEQPGERPLLLRPLHERSDVYRWKPAELSRPDPGVAAAHPEHRRNLAADDDLDAAQRVPRRLQQVRVEPLSTVRRAQHAGPRRAPADLSDRPVDLPDRGNRILRHRRQPVRDIPTTRR